jgi:hypothetical protein
MTHEFLLHFHRRAGLIKPGPVRVTEGVPADGSVLPRVLHARLMQNHTSAIDGFLNLAAPDTRHRPARRAFHYTATSWAQMPLLDLRG